MRVALLALLLVTVPLLGCLGGDDAGGPGDQELKEQATVSDQTGGIQGVVTDQAVQPVAEANISLVEIGETVQTASDGSYAFSDLQPGTYTVTVEAKGFVSTQKEAQVSAGQVANADFLLTRVQLQSAFMQQIEDTAFLECGLAVGVNTSVTGEGGITGAICSAANLQGNTTNDDFSENLQFEPPLTEMVVEARWEPSSPLADKMWLTADIQGFANITGGNATVYQDIDAQPPWRHTVNESHLENISSFFQDRCEKGEDRYCGYNFRDRGWPMTARTFTSFKCLGTPVDGCAPIQQEVDYVYTAFYNQPAPEGYSVYEGRS